MADAFDGEFVTQAPPPPPPPDLPPPPARSDQGLAAVFGPGDAAALAVIGVVLLVLDLVFIAVAKHAGSHRSGGPVAVWFALQAAIVFLAGILQGIRRRGWWVATLFAAVGAGVLAMTVLLTTNSNPGTAQCPGSQPCDTSFGLGAIFIGGIAFVALGLVAVIGRSLGGLTRPRRTS